MERLYSDGRRHFEQGDLTSALKNADDGFRDSAQSNAAWNWKFRELKAEVRLWQGQPDETLSLLNTPPPPPLSSGEFAVRGQDAQGMAFVILRRHAEAQERLKEAEILASRTAPQLQCETLLNEGNLAFNQSQFALAEQHFRQSVQLARQYQQSFIEAAALGNLGRLSTYLGRFDEAVEWYSSSLNLARSSQYRLTENISLANLAWNYQQLGDLEKAISYFSEEEKVIDSLGQNQLKADVFANLGETYAAQGDYSAARESYLKALDIARKTASRQSSNDKFYVVVALSNVATVALAEGKLDEAADYSREASSLDPNNPRALLVSARIEAARHNWTAAKSALLKLVGVKDTEELVRWDAQSELAKIYAAEHQNARAEQEFKNLTEAVESARFSLRVDETRLAFSFHASRYYDDYVRFLVATGQQRAAFQVAEFSRARTLEQGVGIKAPARPGDIKIEEIQAFLRQHNRIVLAYWLAADQSFLWLISPSQLTLFNLGAGNQIEKQAEEYSKILAGSGRMENVEQKGQSLYAALVAPAEKLIPHDAKLVIIPDGSLSKLNFETLRVSRPAPHYWIEDVETEVASSTTLLINPRKPDRGKRILLLGDPIQATNDYPALKHASEELQRIKAHFAPDQETIISGKDATPSIFQSSHPERFGFIHFVTHGTASELSPLESAIILSPQAENSFKLYARDIVKTPLKADIVTISACYGAGTRSYSGEGLVGLAWAFLRAGAHQVVAGLWEVDDRAAVDLMDDFYTELQKGGAASAALRFAKLKMVKSDSAYSRPYYWASLQLYTGS